MALSLSENKYHFGGRYLVRFVQERYNMILHYLLMKKLMIVLCSKCSPSSIRRNETNDQHPFLVQWLIRLPGKQEVHGSIPCEGRVLFFCSVLWSYHHVAISVIRTRETIMSEQNHNNGALAGKQHTALPRVALHVIPVEGGTCYARSVPLRT